MKAGDDNHRSGNDTQTGSRVREPQEERSFKVKHDLMNSK